jgi:hypothetical protein
MQSGSFAVARRGATCLALNQPSLNLLYSRPDLLYSTLPRISGIITCAAYTSHTCGAGAGFSNILAAGGSTLVPASWNAVSFNHRDGRVNMDRAS